MTDPELAPFFKIGLGNELGRICQVIRDIAGTNTAFFVELSSIRKYRKITYGKQVCDYKPNKTKKTSGQAHGGGRQTQLQWVNSNINCGYHNFQNLDQQHIVNKICKTDDDGYQELLFGHTITL
jgi:hypothetical protein